MTKYLKRLLARKTGIHIMRIFNKVEVYEGRHTRAYMEYTFIDSN